MAEAYLVSVAKLSAASVIATAELASLPEALDGFGERLPALQPATSRLAPAIRRIRVALKPAVAWGGPVQGLLHPDVGRDVHTEGIA